MGDLSTDEKVRELQKKLYLKAKQEAKFRFYALYDKVYRDDVLQCAWRQVRKNGGCGGVDRKEIKDIEAEGVANTLNEIHEELKTGRYQPQALRRVYIPKADGKQRPLSIPTIKDRIVQAAVKIIIEPIFEADFEDNSYAYRPKRSANDAAEEIRKQLCYGNNQVLETDLEDCFGSIPHKGMMDAVARRIADGKILKLIKAFLEAKIMEEGRTEKPTSGTPQGGVISPLLANVYLDAIDKGWKPYQWNARLIRYADDLVILVKGAGVEKCKERLEGLIKGLGLKMKESKTKIVDSREAGFDFLGFTFRSAKSRRGREAGYYYPSHKSENKIREKVRQITNYRKPVKAEEIIRELNPVMRGWVNYYKQGNSSKAFGKIKHYTAMSVRKFMRRRRGKSGYGWKEYTQEYLYEKLKLYSDYHVKWANA